MSKTHFTIPGVPPLTILAIAHIKCLQQNTNIKFYVFKVKVARQLQLFSIHSFFFHYYYKHKQMFYSLKVVYKCTGVLKMAHNCIYLSTPVG
jgi:hypothetical protein